MKCWLRYRICGIYPSSCGRPTKLISWIVILCYYFGLGALHCRVVWFWMKFSISFGNVLVNICVLRIPSWAFTLLPIRCNRRAPCQNCFEAVGISLNMTSFLYRSLVNPSLTHGLWRNRPVLLCSNNLTLNNFKHFCVPPILLNIKPWN